MTGSVTATPKYPIAGTNTAAEMIFTTNSIVLDNTGSTLCPMACME